MSDYAGKRPTTTREGHTTSTSTAALPGKRTLTEDLKMADLDTAPGTSIAPAGAAVTSGVGAGVFRAPAAEPTEDEKKAAFATERASSAAKVAARRAHYDAEFAKAATPTGDFAELDGPHGETAAKKTTLSDMDVHQAFQKAWIKIFKGKPIPHPVLALLFAQWKAEGGNNGIYNNNLGNLTVSVAPGENPSSDYSKRSANEVMADGTVKKVSQNYASYATLIQGSMGLIRHMMSNRGALWMALLSGNVEDYAYVLKSYNYYTGPVEDVRVNGKLISFGYLHNMKDNMPSFENPPLY